MAMDGDAVWVASGIFVIKYIRGKEVMSLDILDLIFSYNLQVSRLTNPLDTNLSFITIFGLQLLALNENGDRMFIWNTSNGGQSYCVPHLVRWI